MSNKELVIEILKTYGCSTSKEISNLAIRKYNIHITPSQVAGVMRPLIAKGIAASSKNSKNITTYWMNNNPWESQINK